MMWAYYLLSFPDSANAEARIRILSISKASAFAVLMGYGFGGWFNGTGDKLTNSAFTEQSLIAFVERQGVNTRDTSLKTKNVAAW